MGFRIGAVFNTLCPKTLNSDKKSLPEIKTFSLKNSNTPGRATEEFLSRERQTKSMLCAAIRNTTDLADGV